MTEAAEILLVEDDPLDVELTLRALRAENQHCRIEVVRDGEEALDYLLCRGPYATRSMDQPPNLVLLDLKLPKIGGLQVLRELKGEAGLACIPIIVLTSSGEHRDVSECYMLGVNSYIQKPVNIGEFRRAISILSLYWLTVNKLPFPPKQRVSPLITSQEQPDE
jgi:two-component system, response regulator